MDLYALKRGEKVNNLPENCEKRLLWGCLLVDFVAGGRKTLNVASN